MATGSLTDYPWLFQKIIRPLGLQAFQALGRLLRPATSEDRLSEGDPASATSPQDNHGMADSRKPAIENADSPEPAMKNADSKKPAKIAPTKTMST